MRRHSHFGRRRSSLFSLTPAKLVGVFAIAAGGMLAGEHWMINNMQEDVRFKVTDKTRDVTVVDGQSSKKYLIHTVKQNGDYETYKIEDTIMGGRMTSSNLYGQFQENCTYDATVYGYRNGWLSAYQNVLTAKKVSCDTDAEITAPKSDRPNNSASSSLKL